MIYMFIGLDKAIIGITVPATVIALVLLVISTVSLTVILSLSIKQRNLRVNNNYY